MKMFTMLFMSVLLLSSCGEVARQSPAQTTPQPKQPTTPPVTLKITSTESMGLNDYQTAEVTPEVFFEPDTDEAGTVKANMAVRSSVLIDDGKLFFGNENNEFIALDIETGEPQWLYITDAPVQTLPVYADGKVIFNAANVLYVLNADDGAEVFKIQAEPEGGRRVSNENYAYNDSHTAVSEGIAYFAVNSGNIYGADINTGDIVFTYETEKSDIIASGVHPRAVASGVHYYEGKLYFTDAGGNLCCINTEGEEVFKTPINDRIYAPMTFDGGKIYLGGRSCKLYCVDANNGEIIWSSYSADSTTWFSGGSVVIGDMVYACASDEHALPSFNKNTGSFNRIYSTETNAYTKPLRHGDNIVLAASDVYRFNRAYLMEFDTVNHHKLWQAELNESLLSSPAIYNNAVYFGSDSGRVYKVDMIKRL